MKKHFIYLPLLALGFMSSSALAEWTIPANQCKKSIQPSYMTGEAYYSGNSAIYNIKPRPTTNILAPLKVVCSTPILKSYGSKLDMDFVIVNNSSDQDILCVGYSYDAENKVVQMTASVSAGKGSTTLKANQSARYSNATPVTVRAVCTLPDRGPNSRDVASGLVSIRVY